MTLPILFLDLLYRLEKELWEPISLNRLAKYRFAKFKGKSDVCFDNYVSYSLAAIDFRPDDIDEVSSRGSR